MVCFRDEATYEERYGIPRRDWPWALRGKDRLTYQLLQQEAGPEDSRPLYFSMTLYMDKFRRGKYFLFET